MEDETIYSIINDYVKYNYPIKKYKVGRRFVKAIKRDNKIYNLKAMSEKKKLYYLICDDLTKVMGMGEEVTDMILLSYLKFF